MINDANLSTEVTFLDYLKEGKFSITEDGVVVGTKGVCHVSKHTTGYLRLTCGKKFISVHRLVWAYFNGVPTDPELKINHKDGDKLNNKPSNLELVTASKNTKHAHDTGLISNYAKGERCGSAKLTMPEVLVLRETFIATKSDLPTFLKETASTISYMCAYKALSGKTWQHLPYLLTECKTKLGLKNTVKLSEAVISEIRRMRQEKVPYTIIRDTLNVSMGAIAHYTL